MNKERGIKIEGRTGEAAGLLNGEGDGVLLELKRDRVGLAVVREFGRVNLRLRFEMLLVRNEILTLVLGRDGASRLGRQALWEGQQHGRTVSSLPVRARVTSA